MTQTPDAQKWGFYSVVPRVVRKEYKDLTHAEKWLYSCLRDLCGTKGTCFRTLRSLKEETGISIASLSAMIPHLHEAGLIHAERKARGRGGKEVWHITITDLWQANKEYCSNTEQLDSADTQVVQSVNNTSYIVVQIPNNFSGYVNFKDGVVQNLKLVVQNFDTEEGVSEEGNGNPCDNDGKQEQHICGCANATPHLRLLELDLDPLSEDMLEAQPQTVVAQQPDIAYSQGIQETTQGTLFDPADGYTTTTGNTPQQPSSEEKKPARTKQPKIVLTPEQIEHCRRWYAHFEKVHGEPFETKGDKISVAKYIKKLVLKYDETTIMRIYKQLSEKDFKWSKPSFKFKITPYVVYTEAPSVLQQIGSSPAITSNKPESMDEREARISAGERDYMEKEKAARLEREAQERMAVAQ